MSVPVNPGFSSTVPEVLSSNDASTLQRQWKDVQLEHDDDSQLQKLCNMYPCFVALCHQSSSTAFRQAFDDGAGLVAVLCRVLGRNSRRALQGGHPANLQSSIDYMTSKEHEVVLSMLSIVGDASFYSGVVQEAVFLDIMKTIAFHNVPSMLSSLHQSFLEIVEWKAAESAQELPDALVCAAQRQLALLNTLVSQDARSIEDLKALKGLLPLFQSFPACLRYPHSASASITALSQDIAILLFRRYPQLVDARLVPSIFETLVSSFFVQLGTPQSPRPVSQTTVAIDANFQRVASLEHTLKALLEAAKAFPAKSGERDFKFEALLLLLFALQDAMTRQQRQTENIVSLLSSFGTLKAQLEEAEASSTKHSKGFSFSKLFSAVPKLFSSSRESASREASTSQESRPVTFPEAYGAIARFVLEANADLPRRSFALKMFEVLKDKNIDLPTTVIDSFIVTFTTVFPDASDALQEILVRELTEVAPVLPSTVLFDLVQQLLQRLVSGSRCLSPGGASRVLRFLEFLAGNSSLVDAILDSNIAEISCRFLNHFAAGATERMLSTGASSNEELQIAGQLSMLWRLLLQHEKFRFRAIELDAASVCLALVGARSNVSGVAREMHTQLVAADRRAISSILRFLLEHSAQKTEWNISISSLLVALMHSIFVAGCAEEMIADGGVDITLLLLQAVHQSANLRFDVQVLVAVLSLVVPYVRYSELGRMIGVSIPSELKGTVIMIQALIDLCVGRAGDSECVAQLIAHFDNAGSAPVTEYVPHGACVCIGDAFLVPEESRVLFEHPFYILCDWFAELVESNPGAEVVDRYSESFLLDDLQSVLKCLASSTERFSEDRFAVFAVKNRILELIPHASSIWSMKEEFFSGLPTLPMWKAAILSPPAQNVLHFIEFCGHGNASGSVPTPEEWPPLFGGYTVALWFRWCPIEGSGKSVRIPVWTLKWASHGSFHTPEGSSCRISLQVDSMSNLTTLCVALEKHETNVPFPSIPPNQWFHICVIHQRQKLYASEAVFFLNGVLVKRQTAPYPSAITQNPVLSVVKHLDMTLGFEDHERSRARLCYGPVQLFGEALTPLCIASLFAASQLSPQAGEWGVSIFVPVGDKAVLNAEDIRYIQAATQSSFGLDEIPPRLPRTNLLVSLHPSCADWVPSAFRWLENKEVTLHNLANSSAGAFQLQGLYSPPPICSFDACHVLATSGGVSTLAHWLEDCLVVGLGDTEDIGTILKCFAAMVQRVPMHVLTDSAFIYRIAGIIFRVPAALNNRHCVEALIDFAMCSVRTDSKPDSVSVMLLSNVPLAQMVLFSWDFLSALSEPLTLHILSLVNDELLLPRSPCAALNLKRLQAMEFHTLMVYGLVRVQASPHELAAAFRALEAYLVASHCNCRILSDLFCFLELTIPLQGDTSTVCARLGQPIIWWPYVERVRNFLLRSLCTVARLPSCYEFFMEIGTALCSPGWILVMTDRYSHPVTAALAMQLWIFFLAKPEFKAKAERAACFRSVALTLQHHSHQEDVLWLLHGGVLGELRDALSTGERRVEDVPKLQPLGILNLFPVLLSCLKSTVISLFQDPPRIARQPCLSAQAYFDELLPPRVFLRTPVQHFRAVVAAVRALHRMQSKKGTAVAVCDLASFGELKCSSEEDGQRRGVVVKYLGALTALIKHVVPISSLVCTTTSGGGIYDNLARMMLCLMPREAHSPTTGTCNPPPSGELDLAANPLAEGALDDDDDEDFCGATIQFRTSRMTFDTLAQPVLGESAAIYSALTEAYMAIIAASLLQPPGSASLPGTKSKRRTTATALSVHALLHSCLPDAGSLCVEWFQCQLMYLCFHSVQTYLAQIGISGKIDTALCKNCIALAVYCTDRLVSNEAVPVAALGRFLGILSTFLTGEAKQLKMMLSDWVLYVLSPQFHAWNVGRMKESLQLVYTHGRGNIGAQTSTEQAHWVLRRLVDMGLQLLTDTESILTADGYRLGELFFTFFTANKSSSGVTSLLIEPGGLGRAPKLDLLHGGFDILLQPVDSISMFLGWFLDRKYPISERFRTATKATLRFQLAHGKQYLKSVSAQWSLFHEERAKSERRADEAHEEALAQWEQCISSETSADTDMLHYRYKVRLDEVLEVGAEEREGLVTRSDGGICSVKRTNYQNIETDMLSGAIPITVLLPHYGSGVGLPATDADATSIPNRCEALKPAAQLLLNRILRSPGVPFPTIHWVGNVYLLFGTDSLLCTMIITATEMVLISSSQVTPTGDFFIARPRPHEAGRQKMRKRALIDNLLRRFLPRAPAQAVLQSSTLATFRHSQYYRQLRAASLGRDCQSYVWRHPVSSITTVHNRRFQHQSAALELEFPQATNIFLVILDKDLVMSKGERQTVLHVLADVAPSAGFESTNSKVSVLFAAQRKWLRRQLSTFAYLKAINDAASRTVGDISQYPVMPWVFNDYQSEFIDLDNAGTYRDLAKPVGAINPQRAEELALRYKDWVDDTCPPFHHGTHYSSSAVVMYYMVRLQPFTVLAMKYQGGHLDVADRLFHSIDEAWRSSSSGRSDVKELIPELFALPNLLLNVNRVTLGERRDGTALNDVVLPPWCAGSADRFIAVHRAGLESERCSQSIHQWVDLIFGFKQTGEEAVKALNVFHHLTYEVGLEDAMTNAAAEEDRQAIVAQVDNFGLTPKTIFKTAHPKRQPAQPGGTPIQQYIVMAAQSVRRNIYSSFPITPPSGAVIDMFEQDSTVFCSTWAHRFVRTRPLQYFALHTMSSSLACFVAKEHTVLAEVPSILPFGFGTIHSFAASPNGNVVIVGPKNGARLFVFVRTAIDAAFSLRQIIDLTRLLRRHGETRPAERMRVQSLRVFPNGLCVSTVKGSTLAAMWKIECGEVEFCYAVNLATAISAGDIDDEKHSQTLRGVTLDSDGTVLVFILATQIFAVSATTGSILASVDVTLADISGSFHRNHSKLVQRLIAPLTAVEHIGFPDWSPTSLYVCGHADGALTLWSLTMRTDPANAGLYEFACVGGVPAADKNCAVTCLFLQSVSGFLVAGYDDSTVLAFGSPMLDFDWRSSSVDPPPTSPKRKSTPLRPPSRGEFSQRSESPPLEQQSEGES